MELSDSDRSVRSPPILTLPLHPALTILRALKDGVFLVAGKPRVKPVGGTSVMAVETERRRQPLHHTHTHMDVSFPAPHTERDLRMKDGRNFLSCDARSTEPVLVKHKISRSQIHACLSSVTLTHTQQN